jgi:hypothetical protein
VDGVEEAPLLGEQGTRQVDESEWVAEAR